MRRARAPGQTPALSRRAFGGRIAGAAAALGLGGGSASHAALPMPDPALRDAALRGLALAGHRGDPVAAAAARAALDHLAQTDPEGAILAQLYALLDMRPAQYWREGLPAAAEQDLAALHGAIHACRPVSFAYTDLDDNSTQRRVLPLALVHPPQGIKLLAYCEIRGDFRQFFVRAMTALVPAQGDFSADRLSLLQGLLDKETRRG